MIDNLVGLRYPDFYCIGAQKAATTWLQALLGAHPRVWVSPVKELHFYNQLHRPGDAEWAARRRWFGADQAIALRRARLGPASIGDSTDDLLHLIGEPEVTDEWYGRIYAHAAPDQLCAEVDPLYSLLPTPAIRHMARLSPNARILLIVRDPIDRAWSQVRMLVREGQVPDAAHAIASRPDVIELSRYSRTLRRFYDAFPADQVRAYTYDYVRDSPHGFVDRILAWLELPIEELDIGRVTEQHHVGQQMEMEPRVYQSLRVALADEYEELSEYLPTATATWRNRHYRQAGRALSTSVDVLRD